MEINKKIFRGFVSLTLVCLILFSGCNDNLEDGLTDDILQEGVLRINIGIPAATIVNTRDIDDSSVQEISIFIFDENGDNLLIDPIIKNDGSKTVDITVSNKISTQKKLIYVIANANYIISGETTLDGLKSKVQSASLGNSLPENGLVMSGYEISEANSVSVDIFRTVAQMSIKSGEVNGYTIKNFQLRKEAVEGYVMPREGAKTNPNFRFSSNLSSSYITTDINQTRYIYPSISEKENNGDKITGAYLIFCVEKDEEEFYYRARLHDSDNASIDILPNCKYEIEITNVERDGYSSADEAERHPESELDVEYVIHDHSKNILSMTTDGIRELGVTYDFDWDISGEDTQYITIRWFSHIEEEMSIQPEVELINSASSWLNISFYQDVTEDENEITGLENLNTDIENKGIRHKYSLTKIDGKSGNEVIIRVSWMGLSRDIVISRSGAVSYRDICVAQLVMSGDNKTLTVEGYWPFLAGTSDSGDRLYGVSETAMGEGMERDGGFHFPVMYGEDKTNPWTYTYNLTFQSSAVPIGANVSNVEITISGDNVIKNNLFYSSLTVSGVSLTFNSKTADYIYGKGELNLKFNYELDGKKDFVTHHIPVYHTGFFHLNKNDEVESLDGTNSYYYYEVVGMGDNYWLDRNIGAKSRLMGIDNGNGQVYGIPDAVGTLMTVAKAQTLYQLSPDVIETVCPPGYHIATKNEWDAVRNNIRFLSQQTDMKGEGNITTNSFVNSYFINEKEGTIYFPKSRMIANDEYEGNLNAGYYWSSTPADGLEKEQIGQWVKVINFGGASSTWVIGQVEVVTTSDGGDFDDKYLTEGYKMSVRCVAGQEVNKEKLNTISFNVRGATHVILMLSKSLLFSYPGKAVASEDASDNWNYFTYNSSSDYDDLRVVFAYVSGNGKIELYTKNGDSFDIDAYTIDEVKENLNNLSWPVGRGGKCYDFLGDKVYLDSKAEASIIEYTYRVYWDYNLRFDSLYGYQVFSDQETYEPFGPWGKKGTEGELDESNYPGWYYVEVVSSDFSNWFSSILFNKDNDSQKKDLNASIEPSMFSTINGFIRDKNNRKIKSVYIPNDGSYKALPGYPQ